MRGAATAMRWVAQPATIIATVVLLVNDHLLKQLWPGVVTGKVSDVAGLVVAPALLALALGVAVPRLPAAALCWVSLVATGGGFVLAKVTESGAAVASAAWSAVAGPSYILMDPSDVIALPALAVAPCRGPAGTG